MNVIIEIVKTDKIIGRDWVRTQKENINILKNQTFSLLTDVKILI